MLAHVAFYYVRHGETDWNRHGRMQGHTDVPLNETGRAQARGAASRVRDLLISTICASPLQRAADTAEAIRSVAGCPLVFIDELKEVGFGEREGEPSGDWYVDWKEGRSAPAGGETLAVFTDRVIRGVNAALAHPGPVLIASHGAVFRRLEQTLELGIDDTIPNGVPFRLEPPGDGRGRWSCREVV